MKRIVVTGLGVLSSIGNSVPEFKEGLIEGRSGLKPINASRFDVSHRVYRNNSACTLDDGLFAELRACDETLLSEAAIRSIREALKDAGVEDWEEKKRTAGLCIGTSVGSNFPFMNWAREYAQGLPAVASHKTASFIAGNIAHTLGLRGPISTVSTACAAGTNSIGRACDQIRNGRAEMMIAGGVDVFTDHTFSGFNSLMAISRSLCKPFDRGRDGMMLGDAAAFVVLEELGNARKRDATIYCEVLGYSTLNEAYHATSPTPDGSMAYRVMMEAVRYSDIEPGEVDYVNAHGTATRANDEMEIKAIARFAAKGPTYVSASKSMFGHTLGAAGSIEFVVCALGLYHGFIPPTIHLEDTIADIGSDKLYFVKNKALFREYSVAISNSFGFAGNMAAIVAKKYKQ
jgi:3-oxoacyl-[acyl-carrier-protein] synthase II